jgi:hypothetical protein
MGRTSGESLISFITAPPEGVPADQMHGGKPLPAGKAWEVPRGKRSRPYEGPLAPMQNQWLSPSPYLSSPEGEGFFFVEAGRALQTKGLTGEDP